MPITIHNDRIEMDAISSPPPAAPSRKLLLYINESNEALGVQNENDSQADVDAGVRILSDLEDMTISTPVEGDYIAYNATSIQWENQPFPTLGSALNILSDVIYNGGTPEAGDILARFDPASDVHTNFISGRPFPGMLMDMGDNQFTINSSVGGIPESYIVQWAGNGAMVYGDYDLMYKGGFDNAGYFSAADNSVSSIGSESAGVYEMSGYFRLTWGGPINVPRVRVIFTERGTGNFFYRRIRLMTASRVDEYGNAQNDQHYSFIYPFVAHPNRLYTLSFKPIESGISVSVHNLRVLMRKLSHTNQ